MVDAAPGVSSARRRVWRLVRFLLVTAAFVGALSAYHLLMSSVSWGIHVRNECAEARRVRYVGGTWFESGAVTLAPGAAVYLTLYRGDDLPKQARFRLHLASDPAIECWVSPIESIRTAGMQGGRGVIVVGCDSIGWAVEQD